ncbi:uncharacterized protein PHALS_08464 [Plasmopara halstedii]|uniref:Uncharacterized protein n=1 Tax=Plasmopara halstedii TaxID=4781 RepID=A0A0P1AC98_PLAHL|nr:uncharacterized protein PHALS_08464 [Plasmopara halstedii]CEG38386.1 hypothetical protein PHALS_08464 [Plasmopara halstedii]|eukprot:XP_024574755.1 hypothetical protein PHALS_08464 [Plasmopara halstedii]
MLICPISLVASLWRRQRLRRQAREEFSASGIPWYNNAFLGTFLDELVLDVLMVCCGQLHFVLYMRDNSFVVYPQVNRQLGSDIGPAHRLISNLGCRLRHITLLLALPSIYRHTV